MLKFYQKINSILFLGAIYDLTLLNNLRHFSNLYFHGHSVGGTNPSLLEAMASNALIVAHKNEFNEAILNEYAYYFETSSDISNITSSVSKTESEQNKLRTNLSKINTLYSWPKIINSYRDFFIGICS